ncbi:hypothetical protein [Armatimonas sp.]|uniref:hypothetical protein n=1 Tax=Armatimonas sp. TaxID=1872638 RepID=UPI00286C8A5C|nr:hypothetical protein [Armatimonas sp.]
MSDKSLREPDVNGGLILALSILGLLLCGPLTLVSWIMANSAIRTLDFYPSSSQRGLVKAGQIISIIGLILWILIVVVKVNERTQRMRGYDSSYGANITINGRPADPNSRHDRFMIDAVSPGRTR